MKRLIALLALASIGLAACTEGGPNPLQPPTPRPATPTAEVARPPATPTTPGNPPSNPTPPSGGGTVVGNPPNGGTQVSNLCPSLAEARRLMGVDLTLVGQENCAYTFNSGDGSFKPVNLPQGWFGTTAESDQLVYVQDGDGSTGKVTAKAATWRHKASYPGLTLEKQYELQTGYAALPQNQFQGSIRCRGCAGFAPLGAPAAAQVPGAPAAAAPAAQSGCPSVANFKCEPIDGGYVYKADSLSTFNIPDGWKAYYGSPATWYESGSIPNARQVSLYQK